MAAEEVVRKEPEEGLTPEIAEANKRGDGLNLTIDTEIKAKPSNIAYFRTNDLQNYESESEQKFWGTNFTSSL